MDRAYVESVLKTLDEQNYLFPQFAFQKLNNELKLLGNGGFSSVYEMFNKERPELTFALKVTGFHTHRIYSDEFWNTGRIQWILSQESRYIVRILDIRELVLTLDENETIVEVQDVTNNTQEVHTQTMHLQFVLMEKLDELIEKDRFANVKMTRDVLISEKEVLKLAFEVGQGLATAHTNQFLHRDIKLENIFWDEKEQTYKLGDFGVAKRVEEGSAETVVYTDGYGAPEIERRLYDNYNATADIYSFGITLYLLLNDLKFPGSEGYYSKTEVQYNQDYIFPAPIHASEAMTRVVRKMCSFFPADRYQSMSEVLIALSMVLDTISQDETEELLELADLATETFKEEESEVIEVEKTKEKEKSRAERKAEQKIIDRLYYKDSTKYFIIITTLLVLLYKGFSSGDIAIKNWFFIAMPLTLTIETLLQKMKEFHLLFGTAILVTLVFSSISLGFTMAHLSTGMFVLIGCPVLTLSAAVSIGLWWILEYFGLLSFLHYLYDWDVGWLVLLVLLLVVYRYFHMRIEYGKTTYIRAFLATYIYDKLFIGLTLVGISLAIIKKYYAISLIDMVERMHFVRTGIISFVAMCFFVWWDDALDETAEEGE